MRVYVLLDTDKDEAASFDTLLAAREGVQDIVEEMFSRTFTPVVALLDDRTGKAHAYYDVEINVRLVKK